MDLDRLRVKLMTEHGGIRRLLAEAEHLAARLEGGHAGAERKLRRLLARLHRAVVAHHVTEDAALRPILEDLDAWGPQRIEVMEREHKAEHEAMHAALERAAHVPGDELIAVSRRLVGDLLDHMAEEETYLLHRDVLTDSVVRTDVLSG